MLRFMGFNIWLVFTHLLCFWPPSTILFQENSHISGVIIMGIPLQACSLTKPRFLLWLQSNEVKQAILTFWGAKSSPLFFIPTSPPPLATPKSCRWMSGTSWLICTWLEWTRRPSAKTLEKKLNLKWPPITLELYSMSFFMGEKDHGKGGG